MMYRLYAKQKVLKLEDHYAVTDESEAPVYYIDQNLKLIGFDVRVSDSEKKPLFSVEQELMHLMPTYHVYFENGDVMDIKARFALFRKKIDITYKGSELRLEGDIFSWDFRILDDADREVAAIEKKVFAWGDTFVIDVNDDDYADVAVAMMIVVDHIIDMEQNSH